MAVATETATTTAGGGGDTTTRVRTTDDLATMGFTGAPKIKCTFLCVSVRQKNTFHI